MAIDPSIPLQTGRVQTQLENPLDMAAKAYTMKHLANQARMQEQQMADDQAMRQAYAQNMQAGPDGKMTLNQQGVISSLAGQGRGLQAYNQQMQFGAQALQQKQQQMQSLKDTMEAAHLNAMSMQDEPSYQQALARGKAMGLPNMDTFPPNYDPQFVQTLQNKTQSLKDQFDQHYKQQEIAEKQKEHGLKHEEIQLLRQRQLDDKIDKLGKDFKKDMDPDAARAGNFGQISAKVQGAERLQGLIGAFKGGNLPPAQMEELALGLSNMLAPGGGASRAQVEALVPHTAIGDMNKFKSWLMNDPYGAGQQKFVDMMAHTIDREKGIANSQLNEIRAKRLPFHSEYKRLAPEQYSRGLEGYGIGADGKPLAPVQAPEQTPQGQVYKTHEIEWAD